MNTDKIIIDSLVYFYFGITLDDNKIKDVSILESLIQRAYKDATLQKAFVIPAHDNGISSEEIQDAQNTASDYIKKTLTNYSRKGSRSNFETWHSKTCDKLMKLYNSINKDGELFSYGNAQKWINMTLKYIFLLGSIDEYEDMDSQFKKIACEIVADKRVLDIPIDSYIIQYLWENYDGIASALINWDGKSKELSITKRNGKKYKFDSVYPTKIPSWSSWKRDFYIRISNAIHDIIKAENECPIYWESKAWIEISKKRKG